MSRLRPGLAGVTAALAIVAQPASAHTGSLGSTQGPVTVPFWLVVLTGGGAIAASFLVTSLLTDRDFIAHTHAWRRRLSIPGRRILGRGLNVAGVVALVAVVVTGLLGPSFGPANLGVLLVWGVWWAGFTMTVYLVGNTWPAVDPWRRLATRLPTGDRSLPEGLGAWPSVLGLLALVWIEVVTPVGTRPRLLVAVVVGYTGVTLAGAILYGPAAWFGTVDPIARVFRVYGRVAPFQRADNGWTLRLPGAALVEGGARGDDDVAFVIALLWVTTFDGLVSTAGWNAVVGPVIRAGVPALPVYLAGILAGYAVFVGAYWVGAAGVRRTANTYVAADVIRARFAPSLLPIAAGYHVAHFLGYVLTLLPAIVVAAVDPFSAATTAPRLVLPSWFGAVSLLFVLLGHVLAVLVAHATAFSVFTGRLQPIRSQYPFIALMVAYTMTSLWIVAQPYAAPAGL